MIFTTLMNRELQTCVLQKLVIQPRLRWRRVLAIGLSVLTLNGPALAADQPGAARHFKAAVQLIHDHRVREALTEFELAYELSPHFAVLYDIGLAHEELGEPVLAIDSLQLYLEQGGNHIPAQRRADTLGKIAELERQVGQLQLEVNVPDAVISLDGQQRGPWPRQGPLRLAMGPHKISAVHAGYLASEAEVTVVGQQVTHVALTLARQPAAEPSRDAAVPGTVPTQTTHAAPVRATAAPESTTPTAAQKPAESAAAPQSRTGDLQRAIGFTVSAAGLVGLTTGTIFAILSHNKGKDADSQCGSAVGYPTPADCTALGSSLNNEALNDARIAKYALVMGAVGFVTGVTLVLTAPSASAANATATPGRDRVMLSATGLSWRHAW